MRTSPKPIRTRARAAQAALLVALAAAGCETTTSTSPVGPDEVVVTRYVATRAWELVVDGEPLGFLVRFENPFEPQRFHYSVRNRHQQDLGGVDDRGRAWRMRPHREGPDWLGTGTVAEGAARVLGSDSVELVEVDIEGLRSDPILPPQMLQPAVPPGPLGPDPREDDPFADDPEGAAPGEDSDEALPGEPPPAPPGVPPADPPSDG